MVDGVAEMNLQYPGLGSRTPLAHFQINGTTARTYEEFWF